MKRKIENIQYVMQLIGQFCLPYFIISIFLSILDMVMPIVNIYGLKVILDAVEEKKPIIDILPFITGMAFLMIICVCFSTWYKKEYSPVQEKIINLKMRNYFYDIALKLDLKYYDDTEFYNKYVKALAEAEKRIFKFVDVFSGLIGTLACLGTVITLAVSMDGIILCFSFVFLIINILTSILLQNIKYTENKDCISLNREISYIGRVFFQYQFAKELRIFSLKDSLLNKLFMASEKSINITRKYAKSQALVQFISQSTYVVFVLGTMTYLASQVLIGDITVGEFAALLTASQAFNSHAEELFSVIPNINENLLYINYLREFSRLDSQIENCETGIQLPYNKPLNVEFRNVSFSYPNTENNTIKFINGTVEKGKIVAVVGENGAGKSTIFKLLLRLYDVNAGKILINGQNITEINVKSLRRAIGMVFQDFQHYSMTIRENLCIENNSINDEKIYEVLKKVGLYEKIINLNKRLDTVITKELTQDGVEFSGGEYQKIALARAFLTEHALLLFDEPSSSFDPDAEKKFFENIRELCVNQTAIIISHSMSISKYVDEIWVLKDGKIIEQGTHKELMSINGDYARMYQNQSENFTNV